MLGGAARGHSVDTERPVAAQLAVGCHQERRTAQVSPTPPHRCVDTCLQPAETPSVLTCRLEQDRGLLPCSAERLEPGWSRGDAPGPPLPLLPRAWELRPVITPVPVGQGKPARPCVGAPLRPLAAHLSSWVLLQQPASRQDREAHGWGAQTGQRSKEGGLEGLSLPASWCSLLRSCPNFLTVCDLFLSLPAGGSPLPSV